ncbi:MAG TPA: SHOCT domain-containing protein [Actinomycetes bacterium]|nr:SHOCT domain-containing protein [Actinomycetes bacterium]
MDLGDFMWSLLVIFFMVIYFMILFSIISDLFRSHDLNGVSKAIWVLALLVLPLISILIYLITRGDGMTQRAIEGAKKAQEQQVQMASQVVAGAGGGSASDQIAQAKQLLDSGAINAAEFDALKKKALGTAS